MREALTLPLLQSWRIEPEVSFHPAWAHFHWREGALLLEAELKQPVPPVTMATQDHQRLWKLGDVVELFVQREGEVSYREYQVAPNGMMLSLLYPDASAVASVRSGSQSLEAYFSDQTSNPSVAISPGGWSVRLRIPLPAEPGECVRVSCCRYDYSTGGAPIISSTSPHPVRDFHRPGDWREWVPVAG